MSWTVIQLTMKTEIAFMLNLETSIDLSGNYVTTSTVFNLGMDFKFFSHVIRSKKQNILLQHMHEK